MKKILYVDGPPRLTVGGIGRFERGKPRPVDDKLAERLLAKKSVRFFEEGQVPAEDQKRQKNHEQAEAAAAEKLAAKAKPAPAAAKKEG